MFNSGDHVSLRVKERDIGINSEAEFKFSVLVGTVQRSAHYDPPESVRLFTANPLFPVSVISLKNIVEVGGTAVNLTKTNSETFEVKGSKGDTYTVTRMGSDYRCNCTGFQFRKTCKHIKDVAK